MDCCSHAVGSEINWLQKWKHSVKEQENIELQLITNITYVFVVISHVLLSNSSLLSTWKSIVGSEKLIFVMFWGHSEQIATKFCSFTKLFCHHFGWSLVLLKLSFWPLGQSVWWNLHLSSSPRFDRVPFWKMYVNEARIGELSVRAVGEFL